MPKLKAFVISLRYCNIFCLCWQSQPLSEDCWRCKKFLCIHSFKDLSFLRSTTSCKINAKFKNWLAKISTNVRLWSCAWLCWNSGPCISSETCAPMCCLQIQCVSILATSESLPSHAGGLVLSQVHPWGGVVCSAEAGRCPVRGLNGWPPYLAECTDSMGSTSSWHKWWK